MKPSEIARIWLKGAGAGDDRRPYDDLARAYLRLREVAMPAATILADAATLIDQEYGEGAGSDEGIAANALFVALEETDEA
ncbi:MAG: hypothetical protein ACW987_20125 [Candidatus Thorarchaeota archaeon]